MDSMPMDPASELPDEPEQPALPDIPALPRDLFAWLQALVFALLLLMLCFTFFGRIIAVDGHSMDPTLHDGDMLLLQCINYEPQQGDIVVLTKPFASVTGPIVKRVIATGGQLVQIDYDAGTVSVDGQLLDEPYIYEEMLRPLSGSQQTTMSYVPEGHVFVMGDNRNNSMDSRHIDLGTVDTRYVLGKALLVALPINHFGVINH